MAFDPDFRHPMYLLGRVVARLEGTFPDLATIDKVSRGTLENLLTRPAMALPTVLKKFPGHFKSKYVAEVMALLPAELPSGPVDIEEQSYYWTGYYHQRGNDRQTARESELPISKKFTPAVVEKIGITLFGAEHWQAEMARALGLSDSARIRDWIREDETKRRRVPAGVCWDLLAMLRQKSGAAKALADTIDQADG